MHGSTETAGALIPVYSRHEEYEWPDGHGAIRWLLAADKQTIIEGWVSLRASDGPTHLEIKRLPDGRYSREDVDGLDELTSGDDPYDLTAWPLTEDSLVYRKHFPYEIYNELRLGKLPRRNYVLISLATLMCMK